MTSPDLPPEVRSTQIRAGAGAGSMRAAARAWCGMGNELSEIALRISRVTGWVAREHWRGPAANQMSSAACGLIQDMRTMAGKAVQAEMSALAMAAAFDTARDTMVPREQIVANRNLKNYLVLTDVLGFNAPAIAAVQFEYDRMRAQNNAVMVNYRREVTEATRRLDGWQQVQPSPAGASGGIGGSQHACNAATTPAGSHQRGS